MDFVQAFADTHKTEVSDELAQIDVWMIDFALVT